MSIENILESLTTYLDNNKDSGHSVALWSGIKNTNNAIIINISGDIRPQPENDRTYCSLNSVDAGYLIRVNNRPLIIDTPALRQILSESLKEIRERGKFTETMKLIKK